MRFPSARARLSFCEGFKFQKAENVACATAIAVGSEYCSLKSHAKQTHR